MSANPPSKRQTPLGMGLQLQSYKKISIPQILFMLFLNILKILSFTKKYIANQKKTTIFVNRKTQNK